MNQSDITVMQLAPGFEKWQAPDDTPIVRFFSKDKIESLIGDFGIWFSRFNCMHDDYLEGRLHAAYLSPVQGYSVEQRSQIQDASRMIHLPLISCWCRLENVDNTEMWSKFAHGGQGVCCVTSVGLLKRSLSLADIPACCVRYYPEERLEHQEQHDARRPERPVFYVPDHIEELTYHSSELIKTFDYAFEREIRFICFADGRRAEASEGYLIPFEAGTQPLDRIIAGSAVSVDVVENLKKVYGCPICRLTD